MIEIWAACKAHPLAAVIIGSVLIWFGTLLGRLFAIGDHHAWIERTRRIG
jgi:hypothetical protein